MGTTDGDGKLYISPEFATVAELADAPALGAGGATRGGSSPSGRILTTVRGASCVGAFASNHVRRTTNDARLDFHAHARHSRKEDSRRARRGVAGSNDPARQREGGRGARNEGLPAARPAAGLPPGQGPGRGGPQEVRRRYPAGDAARARAGELACR